ncbi:MAG: collagen-like protein [Bacillota bacterium]
MAKKLKGAPGEPIKDVAIEYIDGVGDIQTASSGDDGIAKAANVKAGPLQKIAVVIGDQRAEFEVPIVAGQENAFLVAFADTVAREGLLAKLDKPALPAKLSFVSIDEKGAVSTALPQKGDKGEPGKDSTVPGPQGNPGKDSTVPGPQGDPGKDSTVPGPKGDTGTSIQAKGLWAAGAYVKNDYVSIQGEGYIEHYIAKIAIQNSLVSPDKDLANWAYDGRVSGNGSVGEPFIMTLNPSGAGSAQTINDKRLSKFIFNVSLQWDPTGATVWSTPPADQVWYEWSGDNITVKRASPEGSKPCRVVLTITFTNSPAVDAIATVPPGTFKVQFDLNHLTSDEMKCFVTDYPTTARYYMRDGLHNVGRQTYLTPEISIDASRTYQAYFWNQEQQKMISTKTFKPVHSQVYSVAYLPDSIEQEIITTADAVNVSDLGVKEISNG